MDEAKSLVHMAMTALFGVLILAAVLALITVANLVWRAFSKQNDANRSLREYAKYSAFDGTEVRGQDVISLLHDTQGSPYVLMVYKRDGSYHTRMVAYNDTESTTTLNNSIPTTPGSDDTVRTILGNVCGGLTVTISDVINSLPSGGSDVAAAFDYTSSALAPRYSDVQEFFLERGNFRSGVSGYLKYKSYVLYDGDNSTDIVGILLEEMDVEGSP